MNLSEENESCASCELDENLGRLRETYFFSAFPLEVLKLLAYLCSRENFSQGDYLFNQGDDDGQAIYIFSGRSSLIQTVEGQERVLRNFGPGDFLGGMALVGNMRRLFSLKAETDTTCLILTRQKFLKALEQFPELMPKIFKAMTARINDWEERWLNEFSEISDACKDMIGISLV
ncbi:Crp/Fnr family transcriptional regulator [Thermodesulfobacteriota bacterium]